LKGSWDFDPDPLVALRSGDPRPFEAFVAATSRRFLAFFRRLGASHEEAEDLTQEVFLKVFRYAANYDPRERFAALAFRVARNAWIDQKRRKSARPTFQEREDGAAVFEEQGAEEQAAEEPAAEAIRSEEVERSLGALAELSESQRVVFELGVVQELPYAVIAESLGIPVGTVKSRMFPAVRRLRALLEPEAPGAPQVQATPQHERSEVVRRAEKHGGEERT